VLLVVVATLLFSGSTALALLCMPRILAQSRRPFEAASINRNTSGNRGVKVNRPPTLREVVRTGLSMHDGRFQTLDQVLEFYRTGGKPGPRLDSRVAPFFLRARAKANLTEFLQSLSGESGGSRLAASTSTR